jgi:hypothetical protein
MKSMKIVVATLVALVGAHVDAQSMFERFPLRVEPFTTMLLGYKGDLDVCAFGTASLYFVPTTTNETPGIVSIITAKHNLSDKTTQKPLDGLLVKINMPATGKPRFIRVPLKHDEPRNYWCSPAGLDLVAIPLPPEVVDRADVGTFVERQIMTPEYAKTNRVVVGCLALSLCMQPEFLDPLDFMTPEIQPTLRVGHLSRFGFMTMPDGSTAIRPHVIDLHASPGNSGATVVVMIPRTDRSVSEPSFLGIVQGFAEESGSYRPYEAPISNVVKRIDTLSLVTSNGLQTNQVALSLTAIANPNLTFVIPVHELVNLRNSPLYMSAVQMMVANKSKYLILDNIKR